MDLARLDELLTAEGVSHEARSRLLSTLSERLVLVGRVGSGGMAEVYEARDEVLDRRIALKVVRPELEEHPRVVHRFLQEARITARLQHPGIVPVFDLGTDVAGRRYFTMKLVEGRTLAHVLAERPPLRRLVSLIGAACEALAYAHAHRVVHRDVKPDNVMIGAFGEVLVMDWGVAKELGDVELGVDLDAPFDPLATRDGDVTGTPHYMAPEQARGDLEAMGPWTDVYALGLLLYEALYRQKARQGAPEVVMFDVACGRPPSFPGGVDEELLAICRRALASEPLERYRSAQPLAEAITAWLDGATRRARALAEVDRADGMAVELEALRARQAAAADRVRSLRAQGAPLEAVWEAEDDANEAARALAVGEVGWHATLQAALIHDPTIGEAHARLAAEGRRAGVAAETRGDALEVARCEALVRVHHRGEHDAWLEGTGRLTLDSAPSGAPARLYRMVEEGRLVTPRFVEELGRTPIDRPLPRGSWLVELDGPAGTARVPVFLGREEHWRNADPDGNVAPIPLVVDHDPARDCVVPAGWAWLDGDPLAPVALPRRRVWVDGFVIRRFPVTHGEVLAFLDDLVARGQEELALRVQPREGGPTVLEGPPLYRRDAAGRFALPLSDTNKWDPDLPAFLVAHEGARAYAAWESERTGRPWRLPTFHERQKAARGVDGRVFVWGDTFDPRRANVRDRDPKGPAPLPVDSLPLDVSVYGVRGLCGNISDWLDDATWATGPGVDERGRSRPVRYDPETHAYATYSGGAWNAGPRHAHPSHFGHYGRRAHVSALGFRLARSV